jgi:anti-sigma factor RsiW
MRVCDERWSEPLTAWLDDEATPEESARVETHLGRCPACASAARAHRAIGAALREGAASSEVAASAATSSTTSKPSRSRAIGPRLAVACAALAAAVFLAIAPSSPALDEALAQELVSHHLRGFARTRPCEIESSDPSAVREWIEARLGYAVEVPAPEGIELIGARACTVGGEATAALLYRDDGAPMTVFVPPPGSHALDAAALFAAEPRCTAGPIGERICVFGNAPQPVFAVADLPDERVLSLFVP